MLPYIFIFVSNIYIYIYTYVVYIKIKSMGASYVHMNISKNHRIEAIISKGDILTPSA